MSKEKVVMKYEKPNVEVVLSDEEDIVTGSFEINESDDEKKLERFFLKDLSKYYLKSISRYVIMPNCDILFYSLFPVKKTGARDHKEVQTT